MDYYHHRCPTLYFTCAEAIIGINILEDCKKMSLI